jgi:hypothetical protein
VSLGGAEGMLTNPAASVRTRVIVSTDDDIPSDLETVWVDLVAVENWADRNDLRRVAAPRLADNHSYTGALELRRTIERDWFGGRGSVG